MASNAKARKSQRSQRGRRRFLPSLCVLCAFALIFGLSLPISTSADEPKSLDAQLLEGLDDDLLKGLPAPTKQPDVSQPSAAGQTQPADSTTTNPLAQIAERMRLAQRRIAERDTTADTQQLQQQIQDDLAALIEAAKKQCAACNKPGNGSAGQQAGTTSGQPTPAPPRDSTNRIEQGTKESTETADVADVIRRFWGHLPDKLREQMQASLSEQFLPKYERLIEDYYKRLAEEGSGRP